MTVYTDPDFRYLPPALSALFAEAGERSFFALPQWYDTLTRHGLESGGTVRLYADGEGPCRALLLCRQSSHDARRLRSLSSFYSCEHGALLTASAAPEVVLRRIIGEIREERPHWEAIMLAGLDPADPGFGALARAARAARFVVQPFFDSGTWYEETHRLSFSEYLRQRPSVLRNTWRRKSAQLGRSGSLGFSYFGSSDDMAQGIADYEAVYRESWKQAEPFPRFIPALIETAASLGAARLGVFRVDGRPAAAQFWIVWRGTACIYKLAHDRRFDDLSVGTVLTMRMFERVIENDGPHEINFGRGDDPYKKLWLPKRRERWGLAIAAPHTLRGLALAARQTASHVARRFRPSRRVAPSN